MEHALAIQRTVGVSLIFLSTENASIVEEARQKYPQFEWRSTIDGASYMLEQSKLGYHMADFVREHKQHTAQA